ncbi:MAG: glutamine--fructose-6-phosphate transaminase (isomerizing) [Candidatus Woesearchaeota archaeon]
MCGIVGMISKKQFSVNEGLLNSLLRLEYRGYDSCGFAIHTGEVKKRTGEIRNLISSIKDRKTFFGIAHTRWATHGGVTEANAHPHVNQERTIFVVHNGIIENYNELKKTLEKRGYKFTTQTDTEVVPHYFDWKLKQGMSMKMAIQSFLQDIRGTFAIVLFIKGEERLYAIKRESPLVLGIGNGMHILASDIYAFSHETNKAIFFDDDEFALIEKDKYHFFDRDGKHITKKVVTIEWTKEEETKNNFEHYMIKEIKEQSNVSKRLIASLKTTQKIKIEKLAQMVKKSKQVVFLACGTSYHASLVGAFLLTRLGIRAHSIIASEFESFLIVDKKTLVIAISQSGETMDVVTVLKDVKKTGAKIASIVNVPYSTVQRMSDISIEILAGQEVCVAATKTFTNQLITLFALAKTLGLNEIHLDEIPRRIKETIEKNEAKVKRLALLLYKKHDIFILGRGMTYPLAREIALKLKEIPYMHAEGMMAGELKHGTIALIKKGTPVISLIPNGSYDMISSTKEVEARGARTIIVSNTHGDLHLPACCDAEFGIYSGIIGHLLSYYIAKLRKCPIDKPRNLAKSVTVK